MGGERVTYRRHNRYNTKSNKIKFFRTPGGKLSSGLVKKNGKFPKCGDCGGMIYGVPALRPTMYKRLAKHKRSVSRPYGGSRCGKCVRTRVVRAFLLEEQKCVKQVLAEKMSAAKEPKKGKK